VTKPAKQLRDNERVKVVDRYRSENADGSITWGYKSADGSFKEETIGADCVTRGRYGYVDPLGKIREFTYESGMPCDPKTKQRFDLPKSSNAVGVSAGVAAASSTTINHQTGYFDYSDNRWATSE